MSGIDLGILIWPTGLLGVAVTLSRCSIRWVRIPCGPQVFHCFFLEEYPSGHKGADLKSDRSGDEPGAWVRILPPPQIKYQIWLMRTDPKYIGEQTELQVLFAARELGINVSIPWGDGLRYDQIWDVNGKLLRIQIKTARELDEGTAIVIPGKSTNRIHGKSVNQKYTPDEIDAIVTFYKNQLYYIPVSELSNEKKLRFSTPRNKQITNINWAIDYVVEQQLKEFL